MARQALNTPYAKAGLLVLLGMGLCGCAGEGHTWDLVPSGWQYQALIAPCNVHVVGVGEVDIELDYLPHVVMCENGNAGDEALRAQAVAARSYLYYKLEVSGEITDGEGDQVYTCNWPPSEAHYQAVAETAGEFLSYENTTVAAFYVAGAIPSDGSCVANAWDNDYSSTEHFVTYNWGLSGDDLEQTSLGWIHPENYANRGCQSQNGADCLSNEGWGYDDILSFFYGADIEIHVADGDCLEDVIEGGEDSGGTDESGENTEPTDGNGDEQGGNGDSEGEEAATPNIQTLDEEDEASEEIQNLKAMDEDELPPIVTSPLGCRAGQSHGWLPFLGLFFGLALRRKNAS